MANCDPENITSNPKENKCLSHLSPIQRYYAHSNIFLTGGTGFIGILLLEKLLFFCPAISKIFLLIRRKNNKTVQNRLDKIFDDDIFSRIKRRYPNFREKIVAVEGDCELPCLGLSTQDRIMLTKEVNIIFHMAATVRFDEGIKKASFINVRAVRDVLKLAQQMPNLKSFVHVSTAFSNCIHKIIKEEIYTPYLDYESLLSLTETLPDDILKEITPIILKEHPNTYSFSKQIAEDVVKREGRRLPVGIHRPSIVISTYKEPLSGWTSNFYGPTGVIVAGELGIVRAIEINPDISANIVPADMVVNSVIASAWDIGENFIKGGGRINNIPVYNFEASQGPEITWNNYITTCMKYSYQYYSVKSIWYMDYIPCRTHIRYIFASFFVHTVPAFIVDTVRFCLRKSPFMLKIYKKIDRAAKVFTYFRTRQWTFESNNMRALISKMSNEDKNIFFCDLRNMNWEEYLEFYVKGIRIYLLKDPLESIPEGIKLRKRLYWIHQVTKVFLIVPSLWMLWYMFSIMMKPMKILNFSFIYK